MPELPRCGLASQAEAAGAAQVSRRPRVRHRQLIWSFTVPMDLNIVTFIFFALAVVIFIQLRNVLGRRTGNERPPFDPFTAKADAAEEQEAAPAAKAEYAVDPYAEIDAYAPAGGALNAALRVIRDADSSFSPKGFLAGARNAYEMILTDFAKGEMGELRRLLTDNVYQNFADAVTEREKAGERVKFTFIGIDKAEIITAELNEGQARLHVALQAEIISAVYDKSGKLIDGNEQDIFPLRDRWVFIRDVKAKAPDWLLAATQDENGA